MFCVICQVQHNISTEGDEEPPYPNRRCEHHLDPEPVKGVKLHRLQRPVKTAGEKSAAQKRRSIVKRADIGRDCKKLTSFFKSK